MISVQDAEAIILNLIEPILACEEVELRHALGRVLAQDIHADADFPRWHNSAMDGYAFRYQDLQQFDTLEIAPLEIAAGSCESREINHGECARIFTGGILPKNADSVVMQEDVEIIENFPKNRLKLKTDPKTEPKLGDHVRQKGQYCASGTILLKQGIKINPAEMGILAMAQKPRVKVFRQPRVSIISTGNELRDLSQSSNELIPQVPFGQIIDSNCHTISGMLTQIGAIPIFKGIVGDDPQNLSEIISNALAQSDFVISSGGVSVGEYDYVESVLVDLGAKIHIRSCAIKPGKPLTVASFGQKLYVGVPGNPASTLVGFWRFIKGAIGKLSGANSQYWYPNYIEAVALEDLHAQGQRETYLWGFLSWSQAGSQIGNQTGNQKRWEFQPAPEHSSGNLISWAGANGLAILKVNQTFIPKGDLALVMMI